MPGKGRKMKMMYNGETMNGYNVSDIVDCDNEIIVDACEGFFVRPTMCSDESGNKQPAWALFSDAPGMRYAPLYAEPMSAIKADDIIAKIRNTTGLLAETPDMLEQTYNILQELDTDEMKDVEAVDTEGYFEEGLYTYMGTEYGVCVSLTSILSIKGQIAWDLARSMNKNR